MGLATVFASLGQVMYKNCELFELLMIKVWAAMFENL